MNTHHFFPYTQHLCSNTQHLVSNTHHLFFVNTQHVFVNTQHFFNTQHLLVDTFWFCQYITSCCQYKTSFFCLNAITVFPAAPAAAATTDFAKKPNHVVADATNAEIQAVAQKFSATKLMVNAPDENQDKVLVKMYMEVCVYVRVSLSLSQSLCVCLCLCVCMCSVIKVVDQYERLRGTEM